MYLRGSDDGIWFQALWGERQSISLSCFPTSQCGAITELYVFPLPCLRACLVFWEPGHMPGWVRLMHISLSPWSWNSELGIPVLTQHCPYKTQFQKCYFTSAICFFSVSFLTPLLTNFHSNTLMRKLYLSWAGISFIAWFCMWGLVMSIIHSFSLLSFFTSGKQIQGAWERANFRIALWTPDLVLQAFSWNIYRFLPSSSSLYPEFKLWCPPWGLHSWHLASQLPGELVTGGTDCWGWGWVSRSSLGGRFIGWPGMLSA